MTTLLALPDELVARIFRFVREDYEQRLLRRAFDAGDLDGTVAMSVSSMLVSESFLAGVVGEADSTLTCDS